MNAVEHDAGFSERDLSVEQHVVIDASVHIQVVKYHHLFFFFLNNGIPKDNFRGQRSGNIPEPMKCSDTDEEDSPTMQTYEQNWCLVCFQDNPKSLEELLALMVYGCI